METIKLAKKVLYTDDPAIEGTNISNEHSLMRKFQHLTNEQQLIILYNSIDAAFTTDAVKQELRKQINK